MEIKSCQNCKKDFEIMTDDFAFYEKIKVPHPTFCPDCRLQRRLIQYNERSLYKAECALCKQSMISMYSPEAKRVVYCSACYFGEKWDPMAFGRDYDFSRSFFEQFEELQKEVPSSHLITNNNNINSDYTNYSFRTTNSYLSFSFSASDHIFYSRQGRRHSEYCFDCYGFYKNRYGYELVQSSGSITSAYLTDCRECIDSFFLFDCVNCSNCFMSSNLRNASYVFRGQKLSKESYAQKIKEVIDGSFSQWNLCVDEYRHLLESSIHRFAFQVQITNVSGNNLENCQNLAVSFDCKNVLNSKYLQDIVSKASSFECRDLTSGSHHELSVETMISGPGNKSFFSVFADHIQECAYLYQCRPMEYSFGCMGIRNKKYCILNKQYTEEEYKKLLPKIIEHMKAMPFVGPNGRVYSYGEFFPECFSPFAYNETIAFEEFPLTKEEVLRQGYRWKDPEPKNHEVTIKAENLPDNIHNSSDSVLKEVIACPNNGDPKTQCTNAYRIQKEELEFYRRMNIPLPRHCPNCRYFERKYRKNPWKLWHRQCMCEEGNHGHQNKCLNEFETAYSPEKKERVYCESCYQKSVL